MKGFVNKTKEQIEKGVINNVALSIVAVIFTLLGVLLGAMGGFVSSVLTADRDIIKLKAEVVQINTAVDSFDKYIIENNQSITVVNGKLDGIKQALDIITGILSK